MTPDQTQPQVHESLKPTLHTFLKRVGLALLGLVILTGLVGAYMYKSQITLPTWLMFGVDNTSGVANLDEVGTNQIFFTLTENTDSAKPTTYTFSPENPAESLKEHNLSGATQLSFSPNGEWVTFVAKNRNLTDGAEADSSYVYQIFRANLTDSTLEEAVANAEQLTDLRVDKKSVPSINDNGEVLFVSLSSGIEFSEYPDDWTVYRVGENGPVEIARGVDAKWLGTEAFLYMSNRGIIYHLLDEGYETLVYWLTQSSIPYEFTGDSDGLIPLSDEEVVEIDTPDREDLETELASEELINEEEGITHTIYTTFDISQDNSVLVVTSAANRRVDIYRLTQEYDGYYAAIYLNSINGLGAFWPQISPDNKYVGWLEFDPLQYGVYDLETLELVTEVVDLTGPDFEEIFITDWR